MISRHKPRKIVSGFTIVEVMVVLAVAGVIMTIVFAAVPQAQRNQRDNTRKAVAQRLMSSLESFNANKQGSYPFDGVSGSPVDCTTQPLSGNNCRSWYDNYVKNIFNTDDPSCGGPVTVFYTNQSSNPDYSTWGCSGGGGNVKPGNVYLGVGDVCDGGAFSDGIPGSTKQFAALVALERTGNWYCIDNR